MLVLLLSLACSTHTETPPKPEPAAAVQPTPAPTKADPTDTPAVADECFERCMRDNMARAVAAEIIEADCAKHCAAAHEVTAKADLAGKTGQTVTAVGTYVRQLHHGFAEPFMGTGLQLDDGTMLWFNNGTDAAKGFEDRFDQRLEATGTLSAGEPGDPDLWLKDPRFEGQTL